MKWGVLDYVQEIKRNEASSFKFRKLSEARRSCGRSEKQTKGGILVQVSIGGDARRVPVADEAVVFMKKSRSYKWDEAFSVGLNVSFAATPRGLNRIVREEVMCNCCTLFGFSDRHHHKQGTFRFGSMQCGNQVGWQIMHTYWIHVCTEYDTAVHDVAQEKK